MAILPPAPHIEWDQLSRYEQTLYLANMGWKIIPLHGVVNSKCTCGNSHLSDPGSIGKHPTISDWQNRATSDESQLREWFDSGQPFNFGIVALASNLAVMDYDVRGGGVEEYWAMYSKYVDQIGETVAVETGWDQFGATRERGIHEYYVLPTGDLKFRKNLEALGRKGVDVKVNGYVVGPGSKHKSGATYSWAPGKAPWEKPVAEFGQELLGDVTHHQGKVHGGKVTTSKGQSISDLDWRHHWDQLQAADVSSTPYAEKALSNICKELELKRAIGSRRNDALNAAAFTLGRLVGGGQISLNVARQRLRNSARKAYGSLWEIKEGAVEHTLRVDGGGFEAGAREPKYANELSPELVRELSEGLEKSNEPNPELVIDEIRGGFFEGKSLKKLTLEKAIQALGPVACGYGNKLFYYDGGYWREGGEFEVIRRVGYLLGEDARPVHSQTMIHFMAAQHHKIVGLGDASYINFRNGMLNLSSLQLVPHAPEFWSTVQLSCDWDPEAQCPTFDRFLSEVVFEDCTNLILEMIGMSMVPEYGFPIAFFLEGNGRNGKGALLRTISGIIPDDFSSSVTLQSLCNDKFAAAQLAGKLVNVVGDLSAKALEDTAMFKQVTGGDRVPAEIKYGQPFKLRNSATMIFAVNAMPYVYDFTHGFYSRVLIIPFDKKLVKDEDMDPTLEPKMLLEAPGIALRAVKAYVEAVKRGKLSKNKRTAAASARYFGALKSVESFLSLRIVKASESIVSNEDIYSAYSLFCTDNGWKSRDRNSVISVIKTTLALEDVRQNNIRSLKGIMITSD